MALIPSLTPYQTEAGCDEAGRGCLAGPVVAAAVILPKNYTCPQLNDSKKLLPKARHAIALQIKREALAWGTGIVESEEIDRINILNASFLAMHFAIDQLTVMPDIILVDGNRFTPYRDIDFRCMVKGDSRYMSIAAASVLAKTYRDMLITQLSEQYQGYGWEQNKGYPTEKHRNAINKLGITPQHRKSFRLLQRNPKNSFL